MEVVKTTTTVSQIFLTGIQVYQSVSEIADNMYRLAILEHWQQRQK